jgi:hypothetical protein
MGSKSSASTKQSSTQQQQAIQGDQNLTLGAGTVFNVGTAGSTATSANSIVPPGGTTSNAINIVTADVNAIDLAAHVADLNSVVAGGAIQTVAHNASDLVNSTLAANQHVTDASNAVAFGALETNAGLTRELLAAHNEILQTAAGAIGTSEAENADLAKATLQTNLTISKQNADLFSQGLSFANSIANQALGIAANATPQTAAAQAELSGGSSPLAGTLTPVTGSNQSTFPTGIVIVGVGLLAALALFKFKK